VENDADYVNARAVDLEEYESLVASLPPSVTAGRRIMPGAEFGRFSGAIKGAVLPIVWPWSWTVFIRPSLYDQLLARGMRFDVLVPGSIVRYKTTEPIELLEIEAGPRGQLAPSMIPEGGWESCVRCGRVGVRLPDGFQGPLRICDVPDDVDVFRLRDLTTLSS
jgi:hypothetical protein